MEAAQKRGKSGKQHRASPINVERGKALTEAQILLAREKNQQAKFAALSKETRDLYALLPLTFESDRITVCSNLMRRFMELKGCGKARITVDIFERKVGETFGADGSKINLIRKVEKLNVFPG